MGGRGVEEAEGGRAVTKTKSVLQAAATGLGVFHQLSQLVTSRIHGLNIRQVSVFCLFVCLMSAHEWE